MNSRPGVAVPLGVISRRELLTLAGATGLGLVAVACGSTSISPSALATTSGATAAPSGQPVAGCILTPELDEGPYYLDGEATRRNITDGHPGSPLALTISVVAARGCAPVAGASVEVWHADAAGDYSGFGNGSSSRTFLRGVQVTDAAGLVTFDTIYPGWYPGRAVHIHIKVRNGGSTVHTGQLFFLDTANATAFANPAYSARGDKWVHNGDDGIYTQGGSSTIVEIKGTASAYTGAVTVGIA